MSFDLAFQGAWRDYQARVLEELEGHLADRRLHVVAAPGSGKTVLGLEVMRRLGRPTLILSPTVAIRGQWLDRTRGLFMPKDAPPPDWTSTSLAAPRRLTVLTYQALHAGGADAVGALAAFYNALGPATLILDEAHHLRKEWWKALTALEAALEAPTIVALTATPPYDVEAAEWRNYETLCGPSDTEISIPELVRNGDLCPHQDYIHLSLPTANAEALIVAHRTAILGFVERLRCDPAFRSVVDGHPWMTDPTTHEAQILETPEALSAMLAFARFAGAPVPPAPLETLGLAAGELPPMSLLWLERLLTALLFGAAGEAAADPAGRRAIRTELSRLGAIEGRRVRLFEDRGFYPALAGSLTKLDGIVDIVAAEAAALGPALRLVILTDHVRASDLPTAPNGPFRPAKLGAAPVFEALRRRAIAGVRPAILTGTLVVIPQSSVAALRRAAAAAGLDPARIDALPLPHDPAFARVSFTGPAADRTVALVTSLFEAGEINLLAGTQALLGEGWDSPGINALILASYVGSYMLSNQMRGRAIRVDPRQPEKTANIWHLATIVPEALERGMLADLGLAAPVRAFDPIGGDLGPDLAMLKRRFQAFEGIWNRDAARIENGIDRMEIAAGPWDADGVALANATMRAQAGARDLLDRRWQTALAGAGERPAMRRTARLNYAPRQIAILDTLAYLAIAALIAGLFAGLRELAGPRLPGTLGGALLLALGVGALYAVPKLLKALYLLLRNGTLEGSLGQVGAAILDTLDDANLLSLHRSEYRVEAGRGMRGEALVRLEGGSRSDEICFLDALADVLGPIGNPRYLIVRESRFGWRRRTDYHAVPAIFGRAQPAERFATHWRRRIGSGRLVYLRNAPGRRLLLRARARSFAAGFQRAVDRISRWQ